VMAPAAGTITAAGYFARQNHCSFMQSAMFWWLGDSLGMVLWLPMTLVATSRELYALFDWKSLPKTLGLLGFMTGVAYAVFFGKPSPAAFAVLPILLWIGLRLGFAGSVLAVNGLALIATSGTLMGHGPFVLLGSNVDLQVRGLQIFLLMAMLMAMPISVVLLERQVFALKLQEAYRTLEIRASQDALTGVANRGRFDEVLQMEWQRAVRQRTPIGLLMVDADDFKAYNDFYGHQAGDESLRRIADTLQQVVQRGTDLVARYGGEEFCILLPGTDQNGTRVVAEHVREAILNQQIVHTKSPAGFMTVSIGCWSVVPTIGASSFTLVRKADEALYVAKQSGRNCVAYSR
jgi:diguanylate cyclase (GGDEF)-like protein